MGHRQARRVPMDFDHPVGSTWPGFVPPPCPSCNYKGCDVCDGEGIPADWAPTDPPAGAGWQLWETTSEGSPVSPVFASAEALAEWCENHATVFASIGASRSEWFQWITKDTLDTNSLLISRPGYLGVLGQDPETAR